MHLKDFMVVTFLFFLMAVSYTASLNINDNRSITNAQKMIAKKLNSFYRPSIYGTIPEKTSEGPDGFQWFEMGFYCK